jgi:NADP-dependent 3-hydroxy acid dehydrogenase YdfG
MATEFCFTTGAACGIGAQIAKASLIAGNRVGPAGRKPLALRRSSNIADNLFPVTLNVTRTDQAEMAAPEPIIAVVFTVGGPVVYEPTNEQFA